MGPATFQDEIVIYRVFSEKTRKPRKFLSQLKKWMMETLEQHEILIIERTVTNVP